MRYRRQNSADDRQTQRIMRQLQLGRHEKRLQTKRRSRIQHLYGITPQQYDKIMEEQQYLCALCGCELTNDAVPSVDHSHETEIMRGIICRKCNLLLGLANDNPKILYMGVKYLHQFE